VGLADASDHGLVGGAWALIICFSCAYDARAASQAAELQLLALAAGPCKLAGEKIPSMFRCTGRA